MGSAYTPGLTVSPDIIVRRTRRLPIKGEVLVAVGQKVGPNDVVARANLPGALQTIKLAEQVGFDAQDINLRTPIRVGQVISKGEMLFQSKGMMGLFKREVISEFTGTVESISEITGNALVREAPIPVEITAYVQGSIFEVMPEEGAVVETRCAIVQGIFGVGGERNGTVKVIQSQSGKPLSAKDIPPDVAGCILAAEGGVTLDAIEVAGANKAVGIIVGGIMDQDLVKYLGYDIGVAITGSEKIPLTIIATEGFGSLNMSKRTFELLKSLDGKSASINGATQIRAGVIRPELLVPLPEETATTHVASQVFELKSGASIRIIREPYFGELGVVSGLPAQLVKLESGTEVRVLKAKLASGEEVIVPRANVEIVAN